MLERIYISPYLGLLFDLLDLLSEFGDVLVQVCTELVNVGVPLCQRLVYRVPDSSDARVQSLKKSKYCKY